MRWQPLPNIFNELNSNDMSYAEKKQEVDLLQQKIATHGELSDEVKRKINYK